MPCHANATCNNTGLGKYECKCHHDYLGDGLLCLPIDPCQVNNGGCPPDSSTCRYAGPNQVTILCKVCHIISIHVFATDDETNILGETFSSDVYVLFSYSVVVVVTKAMKIL